MSSQMVPFSLTMKFGLVLAITKLLLSFAMLIEISSLLTLEVQGLKHQANASGLGNYFYPFIPSRKWGLIHEVKVVPVKQHAYNKVHQGIR